MKLAIVLLPLGLLLALFVGCASHSITTTFDEPTTLQARRNGDLAREGFRRSLHYVEGWLLHQDRDTGLFPASLIDPTKSTIWRPANNAADNFAFMVLTTALLDRELYETVMMEILRAETTLTSREGSLPDDYDFGKRAFVNSLVDPNRLDYAASEYIKDGCLPLTEILGITPWFDRMMGMLDELWANPRYPAKSGNIVTSIPEVHGEQLQVLSRVYWLTGDDKYLEYALRIGDHYLLDGHLPTRQNARLRLLDHGCEIVSGLCELYATVHFARPGKKDDYRAPLYEMLDRILEIGRNDDGLFYSVVFPRSGGHANDIADTFGYTLNGYYTVYLIDGVARYRDAVITALSALPRYKAYKWEDYAGGDPVSDLGGQDGYADAIEGALNLLARERLPSAAEWIDSEIRRLWSFQKPSGIVEGWYADGNFARTSLMYSLWKTQGAMVAPWRSDLSLGGVQSEGVLYVSVRSDSDWAGTLRFDPPRHQTNMHMPLDWPRINQFPEWFTVSPEGRYRVYDLTKRRSSGYRGHELIKGIPLRLKSGGERRLIVVEVGQDHRAEAAAATRPGTDTTSSRDSSGVSSRVVPNGM